MNTSARGRIFVAGIAAVVLVAGLSACARGGREAEPGAHGEPVTLDPGARTRADKPRARRAAPKTSRRALARLVGQKFVVAYRGMIRPPRKFLQRIKRGELGGVILLADNVPRDGAVGIRRIVAKLQSAARAGGNPMLIIATDQEGGDVRRMPGPPTRSPHDLGLAPLGSVMSTAVATGRFLRRLGVGVDLAPVADLPSDASSFLSRRAFGTATRPNQRASVAFAQGLQQGGVAATAKHYPGLGSAGGRNTDLTKVTLDTALAAMAEERSGFLRLVRAGTRLVMVSSATYLVYDRTRPAVLSPTIIGRLRKDGFGGVVISDELRAPSLRRFGVEAASVATRAGVDALLFANSGGEVEYQALLADVRSGRVGRRLVELQVKRIIALKRWIAAADGTA